MLSLLEENKIVKVAQLSRDLNVTEKTIRGDLETLEERKLLKRVHGGAILPEEDHRILPIAERQSGQNEVKHAIAAKALELISPGETI
ncbi:DeoR family transcriptional regulator [Fictibacillus enclensis]|nr:DeoR family transcriptional regulator [Fictibacillus enclensis]MDM5340261.1 DeoR family transcriptional regulator [Fictibacillus enclensis]